MIRTTHLKLLVALAIVVSFLAFAVLPVDAQSKQAVCEGVAAVGGNCGGGTAPVNNVVRTVVNILSSIVGIVAVIMIILAGYKYVTSSGDSSNVQSAENTLLFAIVGLVVTALAQVIVRFVLDQAT